MPKFGKWLRIGKIARNDENDEADDRSAEKQDGQICFAPEIYSDRDETSLPALDFDDEPLKVENLPAGAQVSEIGAEPAAREERTEPAENAENAENAGQEEQDAREKSEAPENDSAEAGEGSSADPDKDEGTDADGEPEEEPESERPQGEDPSVLLNELRALPLSSQVYGLYGSRVLLSCPGEQGGVYLFEDDGTYLLTDEGDCAAYIRIAGVEGVFRGTRCRTSDLEYLLREKSFPLSFLATNREQLDLSEKEGYLPYKKAPNGKGILMIKPLSLYRVKDLVLRVEFADGKNIRESSEYLISFDKSLLEDGDGSKQLRRIGKAACELILKNDQPFFTLQILKVRKNLVLCFPMDGRPEIGDLLAGERITDMAPAKDGALVLQLGTNEEFSPDLKDGTSAKGQRRLTLGQ